MQTAHKKFKSYLTPQRRIATSEINAFMKLSNVGSLQDRKQKLLKLRAWCSLSNRPMGE